MPFLLFPVLCEPLEPYFATLALGELVDETLRIQVQPLIHF